MDLRQSLSKRHETDQLTRDRQIFKKSTQQIDKKYQRNSILSKYTRHKEHKEQIKPPLKKKKQTIDKYCRTGSAPKDQFKRYMMDTQNIFYQQRPSLLMLQKLNSIKIILMIVFAFLLVTYLFIMRIKPYPGTCPKNATCGVFIHCNPGYDLDSNTNTCVVSQRIIDQAQRLCEQVIYRYSIQYGDRECSNQVSNNNPLSFSVYQIFYGLDEKMPYRTQQLVKQKVISFLRNEENQKKLGYNYYSGGQITINKKSYSFSCKVKLFTKSNQFIVGVIVSIILILTVSYIKITFSNNKRAKLIYSQIRQKVLQQKMVNISHIKTQLEKKYGDIDEGLWGLIDNLRTIDRDIGFLQEDFLYWKLL